MATNDTEHQKTAERQETRSTASSDGVAASRRSERGAVAKNRKGKFSILILLQGSPLLITGDDGEPATWLTLDAAMAFANSEHLGMRNAEWTYIIDCKTGAVEVL